VEYDKFRFTGGGKIGEDWGKGKWCHLKIFLCCAENVPSRLFSTYMTYM
jgi:hypothetical protein